MINGLGNSLLSDTTLQGIGGINQTFGPGAINRTSRQDDQQDDLLQNGVRANAVRNDVRLNAETASASFGLQRTSDASAAVAVAEQGADSIISGLQALRDEAVALSRQNDAARNGTAGDDTASDEDTDSGNRAFSFLQERESIVNQAAGAGSSEAESDDAADDGDSDQAAATSSRQAVPDIAGRFASERENIVNGVNQLDQTAQNASAGGINLLNGNQSAGNFQDNDGNSFQVNGAGFSAQELGLDKIDFNNTESIVSTIGAALETATARRAGLAESANNLQNVTAGAQDTVLRNALNRPVENSGGSNGAGLNDREQQFRDIQSEAEALNSAIEAGKDLAIRRSGITSRPGALDAATAENSQQAA